MKQILAALLTSILSFIHSPALLDPSPHLPPSPTPTSLRSYTLLATGDVMLGREVNARAVRLNDFTYPFRPLAEFLESADMVFINLESPIVENCPVVTTGFKFCSPPASTAGLKTGHITVANIANNHSANYGAPGLDSTKRILEENGILYAGARRPAIISRDGMTFGFLGYNDAGSTPAGLSPANPDLITSDISDLKSLVDFVIVSFHWGSEYTHIPSPRQKELAHAAIDTGAHVVVGHHPHWTQAPEVYRGRHIVYSLGNFIFDQLWSQKTREGYLARFEFFTDGSIALQLHPVFINDSYQPTLVSPTDLP